MRSVPVPSSWSTDKPLGTQAENAVLDQLHRWGYPQAYRIEGDSNWDIYVPERDLKIEVKYQRKEAQTGKLAIETHFKGQLSGINSSQADQWALVTSNRCIFISTAALREFIGPQLQTDDGPLGVWGSVGDNGNSRIVTIKTSELLKLAGAACYRFPFARAA
jgi:hypothetical protein